MKQTRGLLLVIIALAAGLAAGWLVFRPTAGEKGPRTPGALPPEVLTRASEATVFIQVRSVSYLDEKDVVQNSGTGFLLSGDGRIVTNWHVVSSQKELPGFNLPTKLDDLRVVLRSGARNQEVLPGRILAADPETDLALLKVEKEGCTFLPLGDSDELVETTSVWILGFPFGQLFSVLQRGPEISINRGYVTSLRHDDLGRLERIQFDAAVNRGNSGGPLIAPDGKVVGIANIALGTSRVNLAVPVNCLKKLLDDCPNDRSVGEKCQVSVTSEPEGATVYLHSRRLGVTPLEAPVEGGYGRLAVAAPGRCLWARNVSLYDGRKIHAELRPRKTAVLKLDPGTVEQTGGGTAMTPGEEMFAERFDDPAAAEAWKQETGGGEIRTWYVQGGALQQFADDELLHAVFAGDRQWTDYAFSSRVRIKTNERDGRAGLIFCATEEGFALFRLFRRSSKVQLAYHTNKPFGWQILAERSLPSKMKGETWYKMEVQARDDQIVCLLDGKVVLEAGTDRVLRGGVGFYAVDCQASFDDAVVSTLTAGGRKPALRAGLQSFWFTDQFAENSGFWQALENDAPGTPWPVVPGGCLQLNDDLLARINVLDRYDIHDCDIRCLVSCRRGTMGVVFRHDAKRRYIFAVDLEKKKAAILLEEKGERKELADADLSEVVKKPLAEFLDSQGLAFFLLQVRVQGNRIMAGVNNSMLLELTDDTLKSGRIGFYTQNAKVVFHSVTVASPLEKEPVGRF